MVAEDFLGLHLLIFVGFALLFSSVIWVVFFLIGKKVKRSGVKNADKIFRVFSLVSALYLTVSIIFTNNLEVRLLLLPITFAIIHASFLFKGKNKL
jgi:hypothetical protein